MSLVFDVSLKIIDNFIRNTTPLLKARQLPNHTEIELARLQENLPKLKKVLAAVENNNHIVEENKALDEWIWHFRDAVDAAEDVLDELEYYEIEEKVHSHDDKVRGSLYTYKRKFAKFLNRTFNDVSLKKLREAVKGLEQAVADVDLYYQLAIGLHGGDANHQQPWKLNSARETGSLLTENKVFGRSKEKSDLVDWLTKPEPETAGNSLSALTIVGIGGIGKTTLAQLAYDDVRVKRSFDIMMWVCVSNNFDLGVVTRKFIEAANEQCPSTDNIEALQNTLKNKIESRKFFVVLDDVWDEDDDDKRAEWVKLFAPLKCGNQGSKIVVTTRMDSVAEMIIDITKGERECLELEGLEEADYLSLFYKHAFAGVNPEDHKHLQLIGEQIAQKLGGCPLVAKVLGAQLNSYLDEYYWEKILKEGIFQVRNCTDDILRILRLSYNHLSSNLQYCFRYCSIFPQDYGFQKEELVLMWMGSGLIPYDQQRSEDTAEKYFNELVQKSFLDFKQEKLYVMHDLLHDLARYVSQNECLRIEYNHTGIVPKTIRHLYVNEINTCKILREISYLKNLRTLIIVLRGKNAQKNQLPIIQELFKNIRSLRLFSIIANFSYKLPDEISNQIHIRYISLDQSIDKLELCWFPDTVYSLYHLRVMKFSDQAHVSSKGIKLSGMSNLVNLRHMLIPSKIMVKVPQIGRLTSLQSSLVFKIGEKDGHTIHELKYLSDICELSLWNVEKIRHPYEAKEANLMKKTNLKGLLLNWSEDLSRESMPDEELINKLQPEVGLRELSIIGYNGTKSPFWMVKLYYSNLITISFLGCPNWEQLPPLGHLPFLENLLLVDMSSIKKIDCSFHGESTGPYFRSLKDLKFKNMKKWEKWGEICNCQLFPQLQYLTIEHCPNLKSIPTLPFSLTELCIEDVGVVKFPKFYQRDQASSLLSSSSSQSPLLMSEKQLELSLKKIRIKNCTNLKHISLDFFRDLRVVESIDIIQCPELITDEMGDGLLPSTVVFLNLRSCGTLDVLLLGSLFHLNSLMILILDGCANITSLPGREVLSQLKSLDVMAIQNCINLFSLGGIDAVESLKELKISGCDKLLLCSPSEPGMQSNPSKITNLIIDCDSLLLVNPLRSLSSVETLRIGRVCGPFPEQWLLQNGSSLERIEIYDASSLHYLPESMASFTSLWRLQICKAKKIESLHNLPASLEELHVCGCNCTLKTQLHSPLTEDLHIPYEQDVEVTEEECGEELFHPQYHKISNEEEESDDTEDEDTSSSSEEENVETSARVLDDSSLVLTPSSVAM
jgi:NB-ARC domain/Rx N-terminal domain